MSAYRFRNGQVLSGAVALSGAVIAVEGGRIAAIRPLDDGVDDAIDLDGGWLLPGFVDTQVNGGGGVLFNDATDVEGVAAIGAAHARYGTTAFLPTLISDTPAKVAEALDAVDAAIAAGVPGVVGVHIEGPFLAEARKGIHDPSMFRAIDDAMVDLLTRPRHGRVMLTLAPERTDPATIARLAAAGVIVSAGHTEANYAEAKAAFDAGLSGVTHLFNAMPPMMNRAPGLVGAALEDPRPWCGLIVDLIHVDPAVLRVAVRARTPERMMLVTDAMPSVGAVEKSFMLQGRPIHVADGRCVGADGTLAGSDLDMAGAVRNAVRSLDVTVPVASAMASASPAAFLGIAASHGVLAPGARADWVHLDAALEARGTWIGGARVA